MPLICCFAKPSLSENANTIIDQLRKFYSLRMVVSTMTICDPDSPMFTTEQAQEIRAIIASLNNPEKLELYEHCFYEWSLGFRGIFGGAAVGVTGMMSGAFLLKASLAAGYALLGLGGLTFGGGMTYSSRRISLVSEVAAIIVNSLPMAEQPELPFYDSSSIGTRFENPAFARYKNTSATAPLMIPTTAAPQQQFLTPGSHGYGAV